MFRLSNRLSVGAFAALFACAVGPALAQIRPATPREAIERNLGPLTAAMRDLAPTDAERARLADITDRGETWAAEMVAAEHHRDQNALRVRAHWIELLARVLRARVEVMRADAMAAERERALVTSRERRTQARAELERAAEQRLSLERGDQVVSTYALPAPDGDASPRATDAAVEAAR